MSGESTCMEPSNVKRKYGDRQSTSSDEGTLIQIYSTNYVGRKDPDYVPEEHETEESSEDSGNEEEKEEQRKEALHLTDQMVKVRGNFFCLYLLFFKSCLIHEKLFGGDDGRDN